MDQSRRRNSNTALSAGAGVPPMRRESDKLQPHTASAGAEPRGGECNRLAQIGTRISGLTTAVADEAKRLRDVADSTFGCEPASPSAGEEVRPTLPLIDEIEAGLDALSGWLDAVSRQRRRLEDLV